MSRKDDHIEKALQQRAQNNDFDRIRFVPVALPQIATKDINLQTTFLNNTIEVPIYINAMTGGTKRAKGINAKLATIAKHFHIPLVLGSLSEAIKHDAAKPSYQIARKIIPKNTGMILANIGADKSLDLMQKALDIIDGDGLQIHLNAPQELLMPEGERDFKAWGKNLKDAQQIKVPLMAKSVGYGISYETMLKLKAIGFKAVDISGRGGTDFNAIENSRSLYAMPYLNQWGLSTVESLLEAKKIEGLTLYASGGIRHALDIVKALALGAEAVGMASYFLHLIEDNSLDEALEKTTQLIVDIKRIMTMLGAKDISALRKKEMLFDPHLQNFLQQRQ